MEFQNIFVSIDVNNSNTQLIKFSFKLAEKFNANISFLNCYHPTIDDANDNENNLDSKHLNELSAQVELIAPLHEKIDYSCFVHAGFVAESIPSFIDQNDFDLMLIGTSQGKYSQFASGIGYYLLEKIEFPVIIVPESFRLIDLDHVIFNLEFEFREIDIIYNLLILCNSLGSHLSCIHACEKVNLIEATKNLNTYKNMFEGHILESVIDFELIGDNKFKSIEKYATENEADLIVLGKTRKTWKNQFVSTIEEKLGQRINIPIMIIEL